MAKTIDQYSCSSLLIQMLVQGQAVSSGTAFSVKHEDSLFLITNWHNVTGRSPITGRHLSPNATEPEALRVFLHVEGQLGSWMAQDVGLYDSEGVPSWRDHPIHKSRVDVVAIPFMLSAGLHVYPINEMAKADDISVRVGNDVFVLGFPFSLNLAGLLPVWKRASIATEPEIDVEGLPKFMVDTANRAGMSGSPVIRRSSGQYQAENGSTIITTGQATRFLGVYSGRVGAEDELKAQLGVVWKAKVIEEIVAARTQGMAL